MSKPKHGHRGSSDYDRTPTYNSWRAMKARCLYKDNESYSEYGGRGISFDPSWNTFETFLADMGVRPEGKTLDRINPNGNYTKENCRWATAKTQARNKRAS